MGACLHATVATKVAATTNRATSGLDQMPRSYGSASFVDSGGRPRSEKAYSRRCSALREAYRIYTKSFPGNMNGAIGKST